MNQKRLCYQFPSEKVLINKFDMGNTPMLRYSDKKVEISTLYEISTNSQNALEYFNISNDRIKNLHMFMQVLMNEITVPCECDD